MKVNQAYNLVGFYCNINMFCDSKFLDQHFTYIQEKWVKWIGRDFPFNPKNTECPNEELLTEWKQKWEYKEFINTEILNFICSYEGKKSDLEELSNYFEEFVGDPNEICNYQYEFSGLHPLIINQWVTPFLELEPNVSFIRECKVNEFITHD